MVGGHEAWQLPQPLRGCDQVFGGLELDGALVTAALDPDVEEARDRRAIPALSRVEVAVRGRGRLTKRVRSQNALDDTATGGRDRESESAHLASAAHRDL